MRKILDPKVKKLTVDDALLDFTVEGSEMAGYFTVIGPRGAILRIVSSIGNDEYPWEHVSVSLGHRVPNWTEMCFIKDLFWEDEECVVQYHPPKSQYVQNHPFVLHLWKHTNIPFPAPPSILVGIKEDGEYANKEEARAGVMRAIARGDIK